MHFVVKTVVQAVPECRAVPFLRLADVIDGDNKIIVKFGRVHIGKVRIADVGAVLDVVHTMDGIGPHVEDVADAILDRAGPDHILHNFGVLFDVPAAFREDLTGPIVIDLFGVLVLRAQKAVIVIGRDILPGLVKAHTAQGVGRELLCVLRVVIGQPVAKLLEAPGVEIGRAHV